MDTSKKLLPVVGKSFFGIRGTRVQLCHRNFDNFRNDHEREDKQTGCARDQKHAFHLVLFVHVRFLTFQPIPFICFTLEGLHRFQTSLRSFQSQHPQKYNSSDNQAHQPGKPADFQMLPQIIRPPAGKCAK